jgi:hypothetical protein
MNLPVKSEENIEAGAAGPSASESGVEFAREFTRAETVKVASAPGKFPESAFSPAIAKPKLDGANAPRVPPVGPVEAAEVAPSAVASSSSSGVELFRAALLGRLNHT